MSGAKGLGQVTLSHLQLETRGNFVDTVKPFTISKHLVMDAFKAVKANAGSAGVDHQSIADFEVNLKDNLYKIWNRMSSGASFPPPVKAVAIPKKSGEDSRFPYGI